MFVRKMHEEQTKRGKKHNGGSDDQSCLKNLLKSKKCTETTAFSSDLGWFRLNDIVSFDFQNLQYLISLLA